MKPAVLKRLKGPWMSEREYRANVEGLNIVFGATLGFVLAAAEGLSTRGFLAVLALTIGIAVTILYIGASERRVQYAILAAFGVAALPTAFAVIVPDGTMPGKLQPTLGAWAFVMALVEFSPRTGGESTDRRETQDSGV